MTVRPASVIIVSRHRARALRRCLLSLAQQDHRAFEVIVVADPQGVTAAQAVGLPLKAIAFDEANISAARNLGLAQAAGEVVAFIDDDAVAEPTWLTRLCAGFDDADVIAATGFVRGRNGISYQWQACEVDALGQDHPLPPGAAIYGGTARRAVKTQGTNCAFRRNVLARIGGFDPALRFFLDEADVNLRLAGLGKTAVIPDAQVHHGFAASARRRADRVPLSLHEIAASVAVFLRRHAPEALEGDSIAAIDHQSRRVARMLAERQITKAEAEGLNASLASGWDDGMARALADLPSVPSGAEFLACPTAGPRKGQVLAGRIWQMSRLMTEASAAVARGEVVTVFCLSPTARAHRMQFTDQGIWLQTGGVFGWSTRAGPRLRLARFSTRVAEETARIAPFRPIA